MKRRCSDVSLEFANGNTQYNPVELKTVLFVFFVTLTHHLSVLEHQELLSCHGTDDFLPHSFNILEYRILDRQVRWDIWEL